MLRIFQDDPRSSQAINELFDDERMCDLLISQSKATIFHSYITNLLHLFPLINHQSLDIAHVPCNNKNKYLGKLCLKVRQFMNFLIEHLNENRDNPYVLNANTFGNEFMKRLQYVANNSPASVFRDIVCDHQSFVFGTPEGGDFILDPGSC